MIPSQAVAEIPLSIGTGGHVVQTVPAAIAYFLLTDSFERAVTEAVRGGGDADTTAAITGALAGAFYGYQAIPQRLKDGLEDEGGIRRTELALIQTAGVL